VAWVRLCLNRLWDSRHRVDTSGVVELNELTCAGDTGSSVWYEPTPIRTLQQMTTHLPSDLKDFTFIDFGSGKGRTILYVSRLNFRRIIGVEFAKELSEIAKRNIQSFRCRTQRCTDIRTEHTDAAEFPIPAGDCVLYFFHPFGAEIMARVMKNVEDAYRKDPRVFIILYYHPRVAEQLDRVNFLRKRTEAPMPFDLTAERCVYRRRLAVYETIGPRCRKPVACRFRSGINCLIPFDAASRRDACPASG
jgi:predicted RNA methylase